MPPRSKFPTESITFRFPSALKEELEQIVDVTPRASLGALLRAGGYLLLAYYKTNGYKLQLDRESNLVMDGDITLSGPLNATQVEPSEPEQE